MLAAAACKRATPDTKPETKHMRVGVSLLRISQPVFVAAERGLFTKHGLDIELVKFDTAQPMADELIAGRLDAAGYVAFPILFGGAPTTARPRVVTAIVEDAKHPLSYLLVRKGSGLRGTRALVGKKIGILPTLAYRKWLEAILRHDGVRLEDVTIVPIAPPLEVDTLAGGGVDALFTGDPMATAALARDVAELATDTPDVPRVLGDPFLFGTFALSDRAATTPEAKQLALALDEAIGILETDPGAGRTCMKPYVREPERAFVDRYPDTRYLRKADVTAAAIDHALEQVGTTLRAADVLLP
jgi:ABC-type nitrate/sulfonate/bicarbonate transport system substrate-binding protein